MSLTKVTYSMIKGAQVNVLDFGAKGDGTTDDTTAIQAAIDSLSATGGVVYLPTGIYMVSHVDIPSKVGLQGSGWGSVIKQIDGTPARGSLADGMLTLNYGDGSDAVTDVSIQDMSLQMTSGTLPYTSAYELAHLVCAGNCSNVLFSNVQFYGWTGDAVALGARFSATPGSGSVVASNVKIDHCSFDGINYVNRQCISVYSGKNIDITSCDFARSTTSTMPGAIDLEPDLANSWMQNINVTNCSFTNIGATGEKPALNVYLINMGSAYLTQVNGLRFNNNNVKTCNGIYMAGQATYSTSSHNLGAYITNNTFNDVKTFFFGYISGLFFKNNVITNMSSNINVGYPSPTISVTNCYFIDNVFDTCGTTNEAIAIWNANNVFVNNNVFKDCGGDEGVGFVKAAITVSGVTQSVRINNNDFYTPNAITQYAIRLAGSTISQTSNQFVGNQLFDGIQFTNAAVTSDTRFDATYPNTYGVTPPYTTATLPDSFPVGETMWFANGDTGLPTSEQAGIIKTIKVYQLSPATYRNYGIIQFFYQVNDSVVGATGYYLRKANYTGNTWTTWKQVSVI